MKKLSRSEAHRLALIYAIAERDSLVYSFERSSKDPGAIHAAYLAKEFRRVLLEEFGEITQEDYDKANPLPPISIFDIPINQGGSGKKTDE